MKSTITKNEVLQLVVFTMGKNEYAVDIQNVEEICRVTEITKAPNLPDYAEGIINRRGKIIPIINLREKFGLPRKQINHTSQIILVMEIRKITNGLVVDSVSEVLRFPSDEVEPASAISKVSNINTKFIKGVAVLEERLIYIINPDKLLKQAG